MTNSQWRTILLPREHGGWGMLGEPALAGLIVAPSWAGAVVAVAGVGVFLARRAIDVGWFVRSSEGDPALRARARATAAVLVAVATAALVVALVLAVDPAAAGVAAAVGAALGLSNFALNRQKRGRSVTAECLGAWAVSVSAAMIVFVGGGRWPIAVAVTVLIALRQTVAILYVRHRLRAIRHLPTSAMTVWVNAALCIGVGAGLWALGWLGVVGAAAVAGLLGRAVQVRMAGDRAVAPKRIGLTELALGVCYAVAVGIDAALR